MQNSMQALLYELIHNNVTYIWITETKVPFTDKFVFFQLVQSLSPLLCQIP